MNLFLDDCCYNRRYWLNRTVDKSMFIPYRLLVTTNILSLSFLLHNSSSNSATPIQNQYWIAQDMANIYRPLKFSNTSAYRMTTWSVFNSWYSSKFNIPKVSPQNMIMIVIFQYILIFYAAVNSRSLKKMR